MPTMSGRMTPMKGISAIALVLCLQAAAWCAPVDSASSQQSQQSQQSHSACVVQAPGGQWSAAAQWVAGLSDSAFSAALTPEEHAAWNDFSKLSTSDWTNLRKLYLDRIDVWRNRNLGGAPSHEVAFYPFGGPDAANLLTFYPDARDYILVGLEPVGCIPSAIADYTADYFTELRRSLSSVR